MAKKKAKTKKRSNGFGESQIPTRAAKDFIVAFEKKEGEKREIFLTANLEKLDESLLDALPLVFENLTKGQSIDHRRAIAALFVNFGALLWEFPRGTRWLNLELAIAAYNRALQFFTREDFPQDWATIQNNLGGAYLYRIRGKRAENLEEAIAVYNRALQIRTREDFPQDWAVTQNNLGTAYSNRIRGERVENLEEAIAAFNRALQIYTREDFPQDWARTQGNLGLAYSDLIQGDKSENLEQAITAFNSCLEIYTQESFPEDWARSVHNLADAYIKRILGKPEENIEQAISLYNQAAKVFTQSTYPHKWFRNQAHLAAAYLARASLCAMEAEQLENLNTAVALLQDVLETTDPNAPTPDYIDAQYQLGTALMRRRELTQNAADLEQSLEAYRIALKAISPEHYDREKMWQALPETQIILGSRMVRDGEWHKGLELLKAAIIDLRPKGDLLSLANAYHEAGIAYEVLGHTEDARISYRDALRLYEKIHHEPGIARSHHSLGAILSSKGYLSKAMDEFQQARDLYEKLGKADKVAEVEGLYHATEQGKQEFERLGLGVTV